MFRTGILLVSGDFLLVRQRPIEYKTRISAKPFHLADVSTFWHQLVSVGFSDSHGMPDIDLLLIPYRIWNYAEPLFRCDFADHPLILFLKNGILRHG